MICSNCGSSINDNAKFCENCGVEIKKADYNSADTELDFTKEPVRPKPSPNVELCADGVYRWIYEFSMMKNPVILFSILKIFIYIALGVGIIACTGKCMTRIRRLENYG